MCWPLFSRKPMHCSIWGLLPVWGCGVWVIRSTALLYVVVGVYFPGQRRLSRLTNCNWPCAPTGLSPPILHLTAYLCLATHLPYRRQHSRRALPHPPLHQSLSHHSFLWSCLVFGCLYFIRTFSHSLELGSRSLCQAGSRRFGFSTVH
ncbi:hypothetical protein K432DRAFT_203270 [Lepidopterella palustris CBS 459.81]|uniref:Uncharacterized protein n=1 Tax=Lepidopterella palustris CBS 459.81 TaxID=1314670 RepID=A0A8E2EFN0_9PEZI|nr:hypothetical protein K432DRAFT_203270 [Lepidopterella palustris CBS 459.81]